MNKYTAIATIVLLSLFGGWLIPKFVTPPWPSDIYSETTDNAPENGKILDVPFVFQKEWYCSEASASMVLNYYGFEVTQEQVHDNGYESLEEMEPFLSSFLECEKKFNVKVDDLKKEIDEGDPIMVRIQLGDYRHTIVIVGYGGDLIYVHDPAQGKNLTTKPEVLQRCWKLTNYLAIVFR